MSKSADTQLGTATRKFLLAIVILALACCGFGWIFELISTPVAFLGFVVLLGAFHVLTRDM